MEKLNILQKFCTKIARFLQKKFDGDEEDYEIYNYKLQIYFSLLFQFSLIMIISLILNSFIECLIFNFIFITLKRNSGGYHMDSLNKCMISGIIISVIFIFLSHLLLFFNFSIIFVILFIIIAFYLYKKYIPILKYNEDSKNRDQEIIKKHLKKDFLKLIIIYSIISIICFIIGFYIFNTSSFFAILLILMSCSKLGIIIFKKINKFMDRFEIFKY